MNKNNKIKKSRTGSYFFNISYLPPLFIADLGYINVTYKTGPGFSDGEKITIDVHSSLELKFDENAVLTPIKLTPERYEM